MEVLKKFFAWLWSLLTKIDVPAQAEPSKEEIKQAVFPPFGYSPVDQKELQDNYDKWMACVIDAKSAIALAYACDRIEKLNRETKLYSEIEQEIGLDWTAAAGIHYRESDLSTRGCFQNGDPVVGPEAMAKGLKTTHVPKGIGPFPDLKSSAVEAFQTELKSKGWKGSPIGIADTLAFVERYNGLGFRKHGVTSQYVWGATSFEQVGGYSSDGVWDPKRVETRLGVAAIMKELKRRQLTSPPVTSAPIPSIPPTTAPQIYEKLLALAATTDLQVAPVQGLIDYHKAKMPLRTLRYWAVVDFTQKSDQKRLYLLDTVQMKVEKHFVAHGAGSDPNNTGFATKFSNVDGSHMSSLGICAASEIYEGSHGKSMRLDGLEPTNSNIRSRAIVMHPSNYVVEEKKICGRSWGCLAVDAKYSDYLIDCLRNGSLINVWKA